MSNSASFWASKSSGVKSPNAPADTSKPVARNEPPKKGTVVMKRTSFPPSMRVPTDKSTEAANGAKKPNWADSDDEEEFLASFTSSGRITELEQTVVAKDSRITDLLASLQEKDNSIVDLESAVEKQRIRLNELEGTVDACIARVDELKKENHKQDLRVQQLVADVDEKDRRITALEAEVDEQCATIAELDGGNNSTQVSTHDSSEASKASRTHATTSKTEKKQGDVESPQLTVQPEAEAPSSDSTTVTTTTKVDAPSAVGPAINLATFPIFVTPTTVKQTAPPPPAPKLKMAIDLSKFAKKPNTKFATPKMKSDAVLLDTKTNELAPKIDPTSDIRTKSREERVLFAHGPKVHVMLGEATLDTVPKYILMQCSSKAFKHFSQNPDATAFHLPAGSMDDVAAKAHLVWMKEMTYQGRVYSITLHSDEKFDDKNLQICRAARVLGLNNMYVGHFTKVFCDRIRSDNASDAFLSKVAALAYPENDPIFDCLANNLANSRLCQAVKNPAALESLLQTNETLKINVEKIEERMRKKQDIAKSAKGPKVMRVGKKMDV